MNYVSIMTDWYSKLDKIGVNADGSTLRPGYTEVEDNMMDCVCEIAASFGMKSCEDSVGNRFIYNGTGEGDYFVIGSHVDSVVSGGRFDGVAGVMAGLMVLKWIAEQKLDIPVKVAIFRMEESSFFGMATVGSKLVSGSIDEETLKRLKNSDGKSLYEILIEKGYSTKPDLIKNIKEYLELHIEQGRVLEEKGLKLGVVNSIAAPVRKWVKIFGRQDHSGATPMDLRKDALVAAAEVIVAVEKAGVSELKNSSVATVGIVRNVPNAFNVIPGEVTIGLDIRGINKQSREKVVKEVVEKIDEVCKKRDLSYEITDISSSDPVALDSGVINGLEAACNRLGTEYIVMPSGAGHDAMNLVDICPVGMLFIPCKEGISHNKEEFASYADIVGGAEVLLEYLKNK